MAIVIVENWAALAQATIPVAPDIIIWGGWSNPLAQATLPLVPSEIIIAGWKKLHYREIPLVPSEIIIANWKRVAQTTVALLGPALACSTNADCPEGYVCINGECRRTGTSRLPWIIAGASAAAAAAILLIKPKPRTQK